MQEWKIKQEIFHRLNKEHTDDLNKVEITECTPAQTLDYAIEYFTNDQLGWVYPAKSYVVAICYSMWLTRYFGGNFWDYLNDPDLLYNNDPYYVPYNDDKETYDSIVNAVGLGFDPRLGVIPDIKEYFDKEFMIDDRK